MTAAPDPDPVAGRSRWRTAGAATVAAALGPGVVPPGPVAVLGDNPAASLDSRRLGFLPADQVLGVAVRRLGRARSR